MRTAQDTERQKAHAKMRDEIRIAVKEKILKEGISRSMLEKMICDQIKIVVAEKTTNQAEAVYKDLIKSEFQRLFGTGLIRTEVQKAVEAEVKVLASKYVTENIYIKSVEKDTW